MLASIRHRPARRRPGKVIAIAALLMTFLVGTVAFSVDIGHIAHTRTDMQSTADAAALAGVSKLALLPNQAYDAAAVKAEVRKYITLNDPGLTVLDSDVVLYRYDPAAARGSQWSTDFSANQPNAVQVTLRRDATANGSLKMFFAPALGVNTADVRVTATAYIQQATGLLPYAPLIPYVIKDSWYYGSLGMNGYTAPSYATQDAATVRGTTVTAGPDGQKEVLLYSSNKNSPGNYGSIDIGSASNGTPDLERQLLYGPSPADFADKSFSQNVKNGVLSAPFTTGGDTGISAGVESTFQSIVGKGRIVPLYDTMPSGNGNNASYHIVAFAAVTITSVDLHGNPKTVWCQPTTVISYYATANSGSGTPIPGVFTRPRLIAR